MKAAQSGSGPSTPMGAPITPGSPLGANSLDPASPLGQPLQSTTPQSVASPPPEPPSPAPPLNYGVHVSAPQPGIPPRVPSTTQPPAQLNLSSAPNTPSSERDSLTPSHHSGPIGPPTVSPGIPPHQWGSVDMKPPVSAPYMYSWYASEPTHNLLSEKF